jgi:hypothetical protein
MLDPRVAPRVPAGGTSAEAAPVVQGHGTRLSLNGATAEVPNEFEVPGRLHDDAGPGISTGHGVPGHANGHGMAGHLQNGYVVPPPRPVDGSGNEFEEEVGLINGNLDSEPDAGSGDPHLIAGNDAGARSARAPGGHIIGRTPPAGPLAAGAPSAPSAATGPAPTPPATPAITQPALGPATTVRPAAPAPVAAATTPTPPMPASPVLPPPPAHDEFAGWEAAGWDDAVRSHPLGDRRQSMPSRAPGVVERRRGVADRRSGAPERRGSAVLPSESNGHMADALAASGAYDVAPALPEPPVLARVTTPASPYGGAGQIAPARLSSQSEPPEPPPLVAPPVTRRPARPGFGNSDAPPSGSTVHEVLPRTQYRPNVPQGQMPRPDGFDEWLQNFGSAPVVRSNKVTPPPQRSTLSEGLSGGRGTLGGPATAPQRQTSSEADFFVLKPSNKKAKPARTTPRVKLSSAIFLTVLVLVLVAVAVAILVIHAHGHL